MKIAIITGASSGLGEEYVKCVANGCADIDEIWAIAAERSPAEGRSPTDIPERKSSPCRLT